MRLVPGVRFKHPQQHTSREVNNLVHDLQTQAKTSIPPATTATRRCNFYKGEGNYASTYKANGKADTDLMYRIVPATNVGKIYLDLEDGPKHDPDFYLISYVEKDDKMRDAYVACIRICPMWS